MHIYCTLNIQIDSLFEESKPTVWNGVVLVCVQKGRTDSFTHKAGRFTSATCQGGNSGNHEKQRACKISAYTISRNQVARSVALTPVYPSCNSHSKRIIHRLGYNKIMPYLRIPTSSTLLIILYLPDIMLLWLRLLMQIRCYIRVNLFGPRALKFQWFRCATAGFTWKSKCLLATEPAASRCGTPGAP